MVPGELPSLSGTTPLPRLVKWSTLSLHLTLRIVLAVPAEAQPALLRRSREIVYLLLIHQSTLSALYQ